MLTLRRASRVSTLTGGTGDYAIAWKCPSNSPSTPHRGWGWMGMDGPESPIHPHPKAHPSPSKAHPKCVWMGSLRAVTIVQTSWCKGEPSMHVQWVSGVCAPVKSVASSRPKVDTPVLFLIRCRWASHARKQRSIWGDFSLQRRRASESTLIWACLRVRHHAIVCGHKQRDCPVSVFPAGGAALPQ